MRFNPDGSHLLGGVGASGVYLDGAPIVANGNGGGWDWFDLVTAMGPAGYSTGAPGRYWWRLPIGPLMSAQDGWASTAFYGNGDGGWLNYLASQPTVISSDNIGNSWLGRVALGFQNQFQLFTDISGIPLLIRDTVSLTEQTIAQPAEWTELADGSWFSRNYRNCQTVGEVYAVGYQALYGGMVVWRPFNVAAPVWLLSATGQDFNPDIKLRTSDGMLVVGSGVNQGETQQNLYELDLVTMHWRKNSGPWQALVPTPPNPVVQPVLPPFTHPVTVAPYKDLRGESPAPCEVLVNNMSQEANRSCFTTIGSLPCQPSVVVGVYSEDDYEANAAYAKSLNTRLAWLHDGPGTVPLPPLQPWDQVWLECYPAAGETVAQSVARWSQNLDWLLAHWPGDIGLDFPFYNAGNRPTQQTLDLIGAGVPLVNRSTRIKVAACFEWDRGTIGIASVPDLRICFNNLLACSPGPAIFTPVGPVADVPSPSRLRLSWELLMEPTAVAVLSRFKPSSNSGKFYAQIANPLDVEYLGIGPAGLALGPYNPDGSPQFTGPNCSVSVQPAGRIQVRPEGTDGAYEQCSKSGGLATWQPVPGPVFQIPCY